MKHVVIVTGSRHWADDEAIGRILTNACPHVVVDGGCPTGADKIAREWAKTNRIESKTIKANWVRHGLKAGPLRNSLMLNTFPGATVIAFPLDGPGTRDCIRQARAKRMTVRVYDENGQLMSAQEPS